MLPLRDEREKGTSMLYSKRLRTAALFGLAAVGTIAVVAVASPGAGITSTVLVTARLANVIQVNNDRVKFQTKGPSDVRVQKLVFAAGAHSGWHHHPGLLVVAVESGELVLTDANCGSRTYAPGSPNGAVFIEGDEHPQIASSPGGATVYVTYVAPRANPPVFRVEDPPVSTCAVP